MKRICLFALGTSAFLMCSQIARADCVILLHGLARTASAMDELERRFSAAGYSVVNARYPSREHTIEELAPPNQGSEVVDKMREVPGFRLLNGPAGLQLGTGPDDIPRQLPAVDFPLGVIAGTRTFNLILSQFLPNPDDGKVSVESTKVEGMADFVTVPYSHPFIMQRDEVIDLALRFIQTGSFAEP